MRNYKSKLALIIPKLFKPNKIDLIMKRKILQSLIGGLLIFLFLISCDKEFDKIKIPVYSPVMAIPLMQTSLSMADVIEPGENIMYDQDGLIHFVYADDSITSVEVADLVNIPDQQMVEKNYEMTGIVLIGNSTQKIVDEDLTYDLNVNSGYEIMQIDLKNSNLSYDITSNINETLRVVIEFPNTLDKTTGIAVRSEIDVTNTGGGSLTGSIDFSNTTTTFINPNEIPVNYEIWIIEDGSPLVLFPGDQLDIEINLGAITYSLIKGKFGKTQMVLDAGQIDFDVDFFDDIDGGFNFDDPELTLTYKNSIGLPIAAQFNLVGEDKDANTQALNYESSPGNDTMYFNSPTVVGESFEGGILLSNDNSDLGDLLSLPPVQLNYSGVAKTNTFGAAIENFVTDTSKIILGFEMNIPISIRTNSLDFQDTIDIDMDDNLGDDIQYAEITAVIQNGFPLELDLSFVLIDPITDNVLETIDFGSIVSSATVDANGVVTSPATSTMTVRIDQDTFDNIQIAEEAFLVANASTYNDGQQAVKLYSTYEIAVSIGIEVKFNLEEE